MARRPSTSGRKLNPLTIALGYALVSAVYIVFSDRFVTLVGPDLSTDSLTRIQTLKGILFISLTAGFIYLLIRIAERQVSSSLGRLEEVQTRYLQLFDKTGAVILVLDGATGRIVDANRAAERFYGWTREQLAGRTLAEIESPEPAVPAEFASRLEDVQFNYSRHRLASGAERDVTVNTTPVIAGGRRVDFILIHDVTERRLLESQLRQAQKMEAIGQLTGGIAHDLNNVLTVVLASADLVAVELGDGHQEVKSELDDLRSAARRGAGMIRKLLSFSRNATLRMTTLDLGRAVDELVPILRRLLPETIELSARDLSAGMVKVDQVALEQVVLNLATNARDAMPSGGTFMLETGRTWLYPTAQHPWVQSGYYVYLKATDTGVGMDEETRSRMFEPFFTTKPPSDGSGLGMAVVYGLVKQHGGFVLAESARGAGTTVTLYLPPASRLDEQEQVRATQPAAKSVRGETILLVEDEDALRRAGSRILERLGYVVVCATDGRNGMEVLEEREGKVDLVITDMVMPHVGGRAFYETARARYPGLQFLFTSGYAAAVPGEASPIPDVPFIQKPWTFDELGNKVQEVLAARA